MGHIWTLDVFSLLWRCHACGCWGNSILQSRVLIEPQSNFINFMRVQWRYMLVSKNIRQLQAAALSKPLQATMWKRPARTVPLPAVVCSSIATKSLQHGSDKLIVTSKFSSPQRLLEVTFSSIVLYVRWLCPPLLTSCPPTVHLWILAGSVVHPSARRSLRLLYAHWSQ